MAKKTRMQRKSFSIQYIKQYELKATEAQTEHFHNFSQYVRCKVSFIELFAVVRNFNHYSLFYSPSREEEMLSRNKTTKTLTTHCRICCSMLFSKVVSYHAMRLPWRQSYQGKPVLYLS